MSPSEPSTLTESAVTAQTIARAATRLREAQAARTACAPVRDLIGSDDVVAAYAVQRAVIGSRVAAGARVVGRKIGLTSPAVQRQLGVDQPDLGVLLDDMVDTEDRGVALRQLMQPKVEAEIAFILTEDLTEAELGPERIRRAVGYAAPAIEIVDSRIGNWDITFGDTVADNGSSGRFVLGAARRTLDEFEPVDAVMAMSLDGAEVSSGRGDACLGDPLDALAWLAATARDFGDPLRAGEVVLSGALGPMVAVTGPCTVRAEISGLGSVVARFVDAEEARS